MKTALRLDISGQSHDYLRNSLLNTLKAAQFLPSLDAVESFLKRKCRAPFWIIARGGHHVALVEKGVHGTAIQRAVIVESTNVDDVFQYGEVRANMQWCESEARHSSEFLKDAPAGSANLRTAMLEQAIILVAQQNPSYVDGRPVVTTGMKTAKLAALAIVELGADAVEEVSA